MKEGSRIKPFHHSKNKEQFLEQTRGCKELRQGNGQNIPENRRISQILEYLSASPQNIPQSAKLNICTYNHPTPIFNCNLEWKGTQDFIQKTAVKNLQSYLLKKSTKRNPLQFPFYKKVRFKWPKLKLPKSYAHHISTSFSLWSTQYRDAIQQYFSSNN